MGVMDRVAYARGGYSGSGSGPAPGISPDFGISASYGASAGGDVNVQSTGVLLIILAVAVLVAAKGLRVG